MSEKSFATLQLSEDGSKFTINNLKPVRKARGYSNQEVHAQQKRDDIYSMSRKQQLQQFSPSNSSITFDANDPQHSQ